MAKVSGRLGVSRQTAKKNRKKPIYRSKKKSTSNDSKKKQDK